MDPEVEARFMKMQENRQEVIYSDPSAATADDDTFGLAGESGDEDGFRLKSADGGTDLIGDLDVAEQREQATDEPAVPVPAVPVPAVPVKQDEPEDDVVSAAMSDMKETQQKAEQRLRDGFAGGVKTAGGFIIFCPYGCKIEVKEKHRGQVGKCPKCTAPFIVPVDPPAYKKEQIDLTPEVTGIPKVTGVYTMWIEGAHVHTVDPEKLKLKADSLAKEFKPYELVAAPDHLALVPLVGPKGGLFGGGPKADELRQQAKDAASVKPFADKFLESDVIRLDESSIRLLRLVQPTKSRGDSMFGGVPVFGQGRIGIQLPDMTGHDLPVVLSLSLTEFRQLATALSDHFGISNFGADVGVPLENEFFEHTCHYTDGKIKALDKLDFYNADSAVELILAGWQCGECGVVISEDARKKENVGGKAGKGIAKTKCPKCGDKMGDHKLFTREELVEDVVMQSET